MSEMGDALRSCMEKLLLVREEKERLMIEATNTISSEQNKTRDLQHKFEDASKRLDKVIAENHNLRNTVDSKEKLIKELKESKAYSDQKLTDATAMLEFSQKQCASLKYEVSILQEELEIRNKEREYDLKSIDAAQRHQRESMKKITSLEAECQKLRTMVQKRLPGPAALAKMKDEVKRQGTISVENGTRRPCTAAKPLPRARHSVSEGYLVKLQELDDENRYLKQLLTKKESDLQLVHLKYEDEACKLSALQMQLDELSARHESTENNHSEPVGCALASKLEHSRSGKRRASQSQSRRITGSDMQLLVDPLEIEKLEMASRPSSAPHQCVPDVTRTDSKMVVSETVHKDLISDDGFSDKYPEWIQDILKVIISKHQVTKISVASILDEVMNALSEIPDKGNGAANLPYDRPEIDKMVATLTERVRALIEKCTENNSMSFLSFLHEKSELILRLEHLNHVCSDVLDGKDNLERFIDEVFLILEWMVNQCFVCLDGLGTVGYITNRSDGIESQRTLSIHEKDAMDNAKSEMVLGMQQETQKETVQITEGQIPDEISENHSQIQFTNSKLDEELSAVRQEQGDSCQEKHSVHCEAESGASDGSKEQLAEEDGKQLVTTSAISAAAKKLAECQETITNLSKQLDALQSPTDADALDKEKCDTLPLSVANLVVEADTKPEGFSSPTNEEATRMEEHSEPDATEKNLEHEQNSGTGPNAIKSGLSPIGVRVMVPKSPRTSVYVDVKKKKWRASLLSRLVFRKKA